MRRQGAPWVAGGLAVLVVVLLVFAREPRLPQVSGQYQSSCCGTLEMRGQTISADDGETRFRLERDKWGLYAAPEAFVGVIDGRITIDDRDPLILRFDSDTAPSSLRVPSGDNLDSYAIFEMRLGSRP
jgi:hypothetical protein